MLLASAAVAVGFIGLIWSADQFVNGAAAIAKNFGMSTLLIGLTIVAFGTSAPEILVSLNAALDDVGNLAIGNAIGSNLANTGLVLGVTALVAPLPIAASLLRRDIPYLFIATMMGAIFLSDLKLVWWESVVLLALLVGILARLVFDKSHHPEAAEFEESEEVEEAIVDMTMQRAVVTFILGLALLVFSSDILVWGATEVARAVGVSELIIGLTVIAIGTSLPELAASIASTLKGHHDIAIGNVIGSNMFNILAVIAVPGLISTLEIEPAAFYRDYMAMIAIMFLLLALLIIARRKGENGKLYRISGTLLLGFYIGYFFLLF